MKNRSLLIQFNGRPRDEWRRFRQREMGERKPVLLLLPISLFSATFFSRMMTIVILCTINKAFQKQGTMVVVSAAWISHIPSTSTRSKFSARVTRTSSLSTTTTGTSRKITNHHQLASSLQNCSLHPIERDDSENGSFLQHMSVPTFALLEQESSSSTSSSTDISTSIITPAMAYRGLEGALNHGNYRPAFVIDNLLDPKSCQKLMEICEPHFQQYRAGKNQHDALQIVLDTHSSPLLQALSQRLEAYISIPHVLERMHESEGHNNATHPKNATTLHYKGLNPRWRIYRYHSSTKDRFAPHIDAGFAPSGVHWSTHANETIPKLIWDTNDIEDGSSTIVSRLTLLLYLNDNFEGGETVFYAPRKPSKVMAAVQPKQGSCLVFPQAVGEEAVDYARKHWPLHEGSPLEPTSTSHKYVVRSDVLFEERQIINENLNAEDENVDSIWHRYDGIVRNTFLPRSSLMDTQFLKQIEHLYNPVMGVENMGSFLYSFIRLTKSQRIVEIGGGYTSVWILQALKDNHDEIQRIRDIQDKGEMKLLDYPWTVERSVICLSEKAPFLTCIDNCAHQKESASGVSGLSRRLGLDQYLQFVQGDAYEMTFEDNSVDVLWADFGVGSRLRDFVNQAWSCLRPGGYLLIHSTLTNLRSREWLESIRRRDSKEVTGLDPDSFSEVSLLEPHKRFQNSITILQKRTEYEEALYSEYA